MLKELKSLDELEPAGEGVVVLGDERTQYLKKKNILNEEDETTINMGADSKNSLKIGTD